jgi:AraC-like DNA-binding protein
MSAVPPARHLLRAKDVADARYFEDLTVTALARAAGLSRAHFSQEFRRAFGESPHAYLLTRRLERAAALLRTTDRSVADICVSVGLQSVGSFTTSFTRTYGRSPTAYRAAFPPAATYAMIPAVANTCWSCTSRAWARSARRHGTPIPRSLRRPTGCPSSSGWSSSPSRSGTCCTSRTRSPCPGGRPRTTSPTITIVQRTARGARGPNAILWITGGRP